MSQKSLTYKSSGVNLTANTIWTRKIQKAIKGTFGPAVLSRNGAFAGMFSLDRAWTGNGRIKTRQKPVLVGCADGVGTKVLLGIKTKRVRGLGIDLVAMNVNDLITCGATPLFFLDYIAVNKLEPDAMFEIVAGMADGCRESNCALLGGETAEMPDMYRQGEFDLAGFAVGVVDEKHRIDGERVAPGDVLIGLPSSGVHSNGFSLVRKVIASRRLRLDRRVDEMNSTLAETLLAPTQIYVRPVGAVLNAYPGKRAVTGMAHITGGGLPENVPRALNARSDAMIDSKCWKPPAVFTFLQKCGIKRPEMFRVFNMGIGYVIIVRPRYVAGVMRVLQRENVEPMVIGQVTRGTGRVEIR